MSGFPRLRTLGILPDPSSSSSSSPGLVGVEGEDMDGWILNVSRFGAYNDSVGKHVSTVHISLCNSTV